MFETFKEDMACIRDRDPAAKSSWEIFLCYPGFKAIRAYRRAHKQYLKGHFLRARMIAQRCAYKTGIEIHPGAKIGKRFFIDQCLSMYDVLYIDLNRRYKKILKSRNISLKEKKYEMLDIFDQQLAQDGIEIQKKRSDGKCGKEAMIAGLNKFLRVYYGRVSELYNDIQKQLISASTE